MIQENYDITIVGRGIMRSSTAHNLMKAGCMLTQKKPPLK